MVIARPHLINFKGENMYKALFLEVLNIKVSKVEVSIPKTSEWIYYRVEGDYYTPKSIHIDKFISLCKDYIFTHKGSVVSGKYREDDNDVFYGCQIIENYISDYDHFTFKGDNELDAVAKAAIWVSNNK